MTTAPSNVFCTSCGQSLRPEAAFCQSCGASAPGLGNGPTPTPEPTPATPPPATPGPATPGPGTPPSVPLGPETEAFASQGQVRQNQTYVGNRLMFTRNGEVESSFLNIISTAMIWQHFKSVLIFEGMVWFAGLVVLVPLNIVGLINTASEGENSLEGITSLLSFVIMAAAIGVLIWSFSGITQEPMSEWELLLDGRSVSADSAYAAVALALQQRSVPAHVVPTRIAVDPSRGLVRNYLTISTPPYVIYVSVIPYGTGLYLAWTMWREQKITTLYREWFRQLRNQRSGAGSYLHMMLNAEYARALRETVHNAMRDGVETAISAQTVSLSEAFAGRIPTVTRDSSTAPDRVSQPSYGRPPAPPRPGY